MHWQRVCNLSFMHSMNSYMMGCVFLTTMFSLLFNWVYKVQVLICRNAIVSIGKVLGVKGTYANTVLTIA